MNKKDEERYVIIPNVGIEDLLTGKILKTFSDFKEELNKADKKNNKLAEELYDYKFNNS